MAKLTFPRCSTTFRSPPSLLAKALLMVLAVVMAVERATSMSTQNAGTS
ncbi:MAG: hypothetical protein ACYS5W_09105 [Planctomycetota bacterium]